MIGLIRRFGIRSSLQAACDTIRGGGPAGIRLVDVGEPEGIFVPTVKLSFEIPLNRGGTTHLEPGVPIPPTAAWTYRAGKAGLFVRDRLSD